jgi:hypothetical protein
MFPKILASDRGYGIWMCVVVGLFLPLVSGCGNSWPPLKQVRGTITFEGAAPPKPGKITLAPIEVPDGMPRRPASGDFDANGSFTLTTFAEGDGIIPGRYSANILCWRETPTLATRHSANYVPPSFQPEIVIEVEGEEPVDVQIDVPDVQRGAVK